LRRSAGVLLFGMDLIRLLVPARVSMLYYTYTN
jgi:hypothetical protein